MSQFGCAALRDRRAIAIFCGNPGNLTMILRFFTQMISQLTLSPVVSRPSASATCGASARKPFGCGSSVVRWLRLTAQHVTAPTSRSMRPCTWEGSIFSCFGLAGIKVVSVVRFSQLASAVLWSWWRDGILQYACGFQCFFVVYESASGVTGFP